MITFTFTRNILMIMNCTTLFFFVWIGILLTIIFPTNRNIIFIQNHPKEFGRRLRANVWNYYNRHYITTPTRTENFNINFELLKTTDNNSSSDVSEIENEDDSDSDKDL